MPYTVCYKTCNCEYNAEKEPGALGKEAHGYAKSCFVFIDIKIWPVVSTQDWDCNFVSWFGTAVLNYFCC